MPESTSSIFFKKFLLIIFILVLIPGLIWQVVSTSKPIHRYLVSQWFKKNLPDVELKSFDYNTISLSVPTNLTLEGLALTLQKGKDAIDCAAKKLSLSSMTIFSRTDQTLEVVFEGLRVQGRDIGLADVNLKCVIYTADEKMIKMDGVGNIPLLTYGGYRLDDISFSLSGDQNRLQFNDFKAKAYDGNLKGKGWIDYASPWAYRVEMTAVGIDSGYLRFVDERLFSQFRGRLNGRITLEGESSRIKNVNGNLELPDGGQIKAVWLSPVIEYIPDSPQKEELSALIKADGFIPVELASLRLKSLSPLKLTSLVSVKSAKLNLDINLTLDINMQEDLKKDFLKVIERFSSK